MKSIHKPSVVAQAANPGTQKAAVGVFLSVQDQSGLHSKFQNNQSYRMRPPQKKAVALLGDVALLE